MSVNVAGLTEHVRHYGKCSSATEANTQCGNKTWEQCRTCHEPICGIHIAVHYRRAHPDKI
jgi:hypothetical protein